MKKGGYESTGLFRGTGELGEECRGCSIFCFRYCVLVDDERILLRVDFGILFVMIFFSSRV